MGLPRNPGCSKLHTLVPHCGCGNSSALNVGQSVLPPEERCLSLGSSLQDRIPWHRAPSPPGYTLPGTVTEPLNFIT